MADLVIGHQLFRASLPKCLHLQVIPSDCWKCAWRPWGGLGSVVAFMLSRCTCVRYKHSLDCVPLKIIYGHICVFGAHIFKCCKLNTISESQVCVKEKLKLDIKAVKTDFPQLWPLKKIDLRVLSGSVLNKAWTIRNL